MLLSVTHTPTHTRTIPKIFAHIDPTTLSVPHVAFIFQSLLCLSECHRTIDTLFTKLVSKESFETMVLGTVAKVVRDEIVCGTRSDVHYRTRRDRHNEWE